MDTAERALERTTAWHGVALVAGIAAVGRLLFGYDTGAISGAILYLREDFRLTPGAEGLVVGMVSSIASGLETRGRTLEEIGQFWK